MNYFEQVFRKKKVIITGHTGFKGSWLTSWLNLLGAEVVGISLDSSTVPSHFNFLQLSRDIKDIRLDIRDYNSLESIVLTEKPDFFFHLAAQAIVNLSYEEPRLTWEHNVIGTLNVLDSLKNLSNSCISVIITSDKCYQNNEWLWGYKETDRLGGDDPYSSSKAAAEILFQSYFKSYFSHSKIRIASARAGNVIGGGDWSSFRIVPDAIKAWSNSKPVFLRNPHSTRPWQHVLEPLSGYLALAASLSKSDYISGESFNFGPKSDEVYSVFDLVSKMSKRWPNSKIEILDLDIKYKESKLLKLNCDKSLSLIKWENTFSIDETICATIDWYKNYYFNKSIDSVNFTKNQILFYSNQAKEKGLLWAQ